MAEELTLKVDGKQLSGWQEIEVVRGIEQMPNSFRIVATEASPIYSDAVMVQEGQACTVSLGPDLVITGYIDVVNPAFAEGAHAVQIVGRGKCQDLVDCSAEWKGCQVSGANALEIATKLAAPYGITVKALGDPGPVVPQFNINIGETPAEILELITRHAQLLYYEGTDGNLILAQAGSDKAGSGFVEGQNVQAASAMRSVAQRYSTYTCSLLSMTTSSLFEDAPGLFFFSTPDPNVKRHRTLYSVAEGVMGGQELAQKRAVWDAARRAGRGFQVRLTTDSWRDGKGKLWTPNTLAPVTLPRLKVKEAGLCIAEVVYRLNKGGRTADLLLMPATAFKPEPIQLQPVLKGLTPQAAPATGG
jgi:prophage tail gpP-like protein